MFEVFEKDFFAIQSTKSKKTAIFVYISNKWFGRGRDCVNFDAVLVLKARLSRFIWR